MENITLRSKNKLNNAKNDQDLIVQVLDWFTTEEERDISDSDSDSDSKYKPVIYDYIIMLFCNDINGNSISIKINGFKPYFYIKVPKKWSRSDAKNFINQLGLSKATKSSIVTYTIEKKHDIWGFTNGELFNFLKIVFVSKKATYQFLSKLKNNKKFNEKPNGDFKLYESNIDPMLRFAHIKDISPAGWIKIDSGKYKINKPRQTHCQLDITTSWNEINSYECTAMAPFIIGGFDIECESSHGDFPLATKDYKKLAANIVDVCDNLKEKIKKARSIKDFNTADNLSNLIDDDDNYKNYIIELISTAFKDISDDINIDTVYTKFITKNDEHGNIINVREKPSNRDIEKVVNDIYPIIIRTYGDDFTRDNRIIKINNIMTKNFPGIDGDRVIQIGTTLQYYGESECFLKHIITLGKCNDIDGSVVEYYDTEEEVLIAWAKLIRKVDPDILLGYNIWGFDLKYLYERAEEISCLSKFQELGRIKGLASELVAKEQSSAAFGDNLLYLLDMPGRVMFDLMKYVQRNFNLDSYKLDNVALHFMNEQKLDVSPQDIFRLQKSGSSQDICEIAKYCIQDCELCNRLCKKLECITNNVGMANVCSVPLSYIFSRGQGIKVFSFFSKQCRLENYLIPTIKAKKTDNIEDLEGYEGAIVLDPKPGIYIDDPIAVVDYGSLYPSCMIATNLSHDTIVLDPKYDNIDGIEYKNVTYDNYKYIKVGAAVKKVIDEKKPTITCRYAQPKYTIDNEGNQVIKKEDRGIVPRILMDVLKARKDTRTKIKTEPDEFKKSILDGLQLAYKITANSIYGGIGAKTSQIYLKDIAASTTSEGRRMLQYAADFTKENFDADIVYGDTDSIFIKFNLKDEYGNKLTGRDAIKKAIDLGIELENKVQPTLTYPHKLEYEKTFGPFVLLSKKRYVGKKYEFDPDKSYINSMGIVLKRRDNAGIVKHVYGGIIDKIMDDKDIEGSKEFLREELMKLARGEFPLENLIITKSLRGYYKDPTKIAHKALADRITERDPGNKPNSGDRIPYIYIETPKTKNKTILQGDRIESPDFIRDNNLTPDYGFYITNQLMKPICQIYDLVMPNSKVLFEESLRYVNNKRDKVEPITKWFKSK